MNDAPARLYTDLAAWWPLLSPPSHYGEDAGFDVRTRTDPWKRDLFIARRVG